MPHDDEGYDDRSSTMWQRAFVGFVRRTAGRSRHEPLSEEDWYAVLTAHATRRGRALERAWSVLPSSPRCRMCGAPFGRPGSLVAGPLGHRPSRMNPELCAICLESSPPGGATMIVGVLFADLRGFTTRSATMQPREVSRLLSAFYKAAERSLFPEAIVDKLIGDEVMALYLPHLDHLGTGETVADIMLRQATRLVARVDRALDGRARLGVGLDRGEAHVGNVGDRALHDFTAVGAVVNTAARLQSHAAGGQVVMSAAVAAQLSDPVGREAVLELKGVPTPQHVRVVDV